MAAPSVTGGQEEYRKDCSTREIVTRSRQNKHLRARSFEDLFRNSWRREASVKGQLAQTGSANRHETIFYFRPGARVESQTNDRWIDRLFFSSNPENSSIFIHIYDLSNTTFTRNPTLIHLFTLRSKFE